MLLGRLGSLVAEEVARKNFPRDCVCEGFADGIPLPLTLLGSRSSGKGVVLNAVLFSERGLRLAAVLCSHYNH